LKFKESGSNLTKVDNLKFNAIKENLIAGWSSLVARQAHNLKVLGSNPSPATNFDVFLKNSFNLEHFKIKFLKIINIHISV
jgi:hypothetical protein